VTLLKLAPESERLRRIARAYAAGEMSDDEYRQIRAGVIDDFDTQGGDWGEDTQQRWAPVRPNDAAAEESAAANGQIEGKIAAPPLPAAGVASVASIRTIMLAGVIALAIVLYLLL